VGLSSVILLAGLACAAPPQRGDVIGEWRFDTEAAQQAWSKAAYASFQPGREGRLALCVNVPAGEATGGHMVALKVDLSKYAGCRVFGECLVKAEGVTPPAESWNGVKVMLHYRSPALGDRWINQGNVHGTFDWKALRFTDTLPADVGVADLNLGLQSSAGKVWFDQLRLTVLAPPRPPRPKPADNPPPAYKGHNLPRLRGVMSPNVFRDEDLRVLGEEWRANLIRWQLCRNWGRAGTDRDLVEYARWIDAKLDELDKVLAACLRYGLKVVIDVHSPPGGRTAEMDLAIGHEPLYQDAFVALWERIARRFKGHAALWGYDLVNEPQQNTPPLGVPDFLGIQVRAAKAIRAIDPVTPIIIEADQWDSAAAFANLDPVDVPNVVYQVHMYVPGEFTHQGVYNTKTGISYPGKINGVEWDKERLRKVLAPVREFQLAYNVHIYAGEFSAIRWAPGDSAYRYLRDCIDLFEEYGWDWSYHAYREWDGWSVEHGSDPKDNKPTKQPTDRKKLLLEWFGRNQRP